MKLTCAILAGGRSRRMGRDKAWLEINGKPLIQHVIDALSEFPILISANDAEYDRLGHPRVEDFLPHACSFSGVHASIRAAQTMWVLAVACDMPFVNLDLVRHLYDRREGHRIVVPESENGLEPLHALYSRPCVPKMEDAAAEGQLGLQKFCRTQPSRIVPVRKDEWMVQGQSPFLNVNTPEEFDALSNS